ncbi:spore protease YyaC [Bacillus sp. FJAT-45350]|uniref:spore protease YyaC n=1 Tax=Bacillus sp. FJAT-45350 TaxID=2011014 RepID=UPI000BB814C5|nr:spore protease YyaC [Bacillus sp. FJAT-45350]
MIRNRGFFQKNSPPCRVHMEEPDASTVVAEQLHDIIEPFSQRELVIVCIGTDRSTGDSLGPLIGSKLQEKSLTSFSVYGTLEHPVHAVNLEEQLKMIESNHHRPYIIGIDACLGRMNSVGKISIGKGPVKPGAAVKKELPEVGEMHITGIVNIGGMMEYFVLQNTRLHVVMKMADTIVKSIRMADKHLSVPKTRKPSLLQAIKPSIFSKDNRETNLS